MPSLADALHLRGKPQTALLGLLLLLAHVVQVYPIYQDDGHFHPALVRPEHLMTENELFQKQFFEDLHEAKMEERKNKRRAAARSLQTETDDGSGDGYTEDPYLSDEEYACSLDPGPGESYCCTNCQTGMEKCRKLIGKLVEDKVRACMSLRTSQ